MQKTSLKVIQGNLLTTKVDAIAHQTNCVTRNVHGLARHIADMYQDPSVFLNTLPNSLNMDLYGTSDAITAPLTAEFKYVINLYGQLYPGKTGWGLDTRGSRLTAFQCALEDMESWSDTVEQGYKSVAIPFGIGCGLAQGKWQDYYEVIKDFNDKSSLDIVLVKKK